MGKAILLLLALSPSPGEPGGRSQEEAGAAVEKGVAWLKKRAESGRPWHYRSHPLRGLMALTLLVGGEDPADPILSRLLQLLNDEPWKDTYSVAVRACVHSILLEKNPADGDGFIRLAMAGKFMVDTQMGNGMWDYGYGYLPGGTGAYQGNASAVIVGDMTSAATRSLVAFGKTVQGRLRELKEFSKKAEPQVLVLGVQPGGMPRPRLHHGDFSNSQFGALGLLAAASPRLQLTPALQVRLSLPAEVVEKALRSWTEAQNVDGGWGYEPRPSESSASYGSMTAGGLFAVQALARLAEGVDLKAVPRAGADRLSKAAGEARKSAEKATRWIETLPALEGNPRVSGAFPQEDPAFHAYYALFSIERAAAVGRLEKFGDHDWYAQGSAFILRTQEADGGWPEEVMLKGEGKDPEGARRVVSTCFSLLFLKRATARISRHAVTK